MRDADRSPVPLYLDRTMCPVPLLYRRKVSRGAASCSKTLCNKNPISMQMLFKRTPRNLNLLYTASDSSCSSVQFSSVWVHDSSTWDQCLFFKKLYLLILVFLLTKASLCYVLELEDTSSFSCLNISVASLSLFWTRTAWWRCGYIICLILIEYTVQYTVYRSVPIGL